MRPSTRQAGVLPLLPLDFERLYWQHDVVLPSQAAANVAIAPHRLPPALAAALEGDKS
jgi:hypothetical protein